MTDDDTSAKEEATDEGQPAGRAAEDDQTVTPAAEAEEVSAEGAASEVAEPAAPSLEEQLAAARADTKAMRDKMLRVAADFENYRKRSSREAEDARRRGTLGAVRDLLPVFDNLERATAHVDETPETAAIVEGLKLVHKQFLDVLGRMGIERIAALGLPFDPTSHESIQYLHSDEHGPGIVMAELQPGYRLGDTLLRPAMVVVSRGAEPAPAEEPAAEESEAESAEDAPPAETAAAESEAPAETEPADQVAAGEPEGDPAAGDA